MKIVVNGNLCFADGWKTKHIISHCRDQYEIVDADGVKATLHRLAGDERVSPDRVFCEAIIKPEWVFKDQ
jgi:hypothetical protein